MDSKINMQCTMATYKFIKIFKSKIACLLKIRFMLGLAQLIVKTKLVHTYFVNN